jgi:hypothetical protein
LQVPIAEARRTNNPSTTPPFHATLQKVAGAKGLMADATEHAYGPRRRRERTEQSVVDLYWLIGAMVGSGLFIFLGGPPARRFANAVRRRVDGRTGRV